MQSPARPVRELSSLTSRCTLSRRPWRPHAQGFAAGQRLPEGLNGCVSTRTSRASAQPGLIGQKAKIRTPDRALPESLVEVVKSLLILVEQEQGQAESNRLGDQADYRLYNLICARDMVGNRPFAFFFEVAKRGSATSVEITVHQALVRGRPAMVQRSNTSGGKSGRDSLRTARASSRKVWNSAV